VLSFCEPRSPGELESFDRLNWDYLAYLRAEPGMRTIVESYYPDAQFRAALATPQEWPSGLKRLALLGGQPVGCGTIQSLRPGDCEIKRVYLAPTARGGGAGFALMTQLIEDCREMGFRRILMDTGRALTAAQALYDRMGFIRRGPYQSVPDVARDMLVFYEMPLSQSQ